MKIAQKYSHLNGLEFLIVHQKLLWEEICAAISAVDATQTKTKQSQENNRKMGEMLYSPGGMNKLFKDEFTKREWFERKISYYVNEDLRISREIAHLIDATEQKQIIEKAGLTAFSTYNQVDFVKDRIAVEMQFGKYFSVQYDLHVKHTFFYGRGDIDVGIEIIPMHSLMREMSSGVPWYENELMNIVREGRSNPSVPIVLIGVEP